MRDNRRSRSTSDASSDRDIPTALIRESDRFRLREPPYEDIDGLAASIAVQGQLMPISVLRESADGHHDLIFGHRRVAALEHDRCTVGLARCA